MRLSVLDTRTPSLRSSLVTLSKAVFPSKGAQRPLPNVAMKHGRVSEHKCKQQGWMQMFQTPKDTKQQSSWRTGCSSKLARTWLCKSEDLSSPSIDDRGLKHLKPQQDTKHLCCLWLICTLTSLLLERSLH